MLRELEKLPRTKGRFFNLYLRIALTYLNMGELAQAEVYVKKNQALLNESKSWPNVEMYRSAWTSSVENGNARLFEVRGQFKEAEAAYRRAQVLMREALPRSASWPSKPPPGSMEATIDNLTINEGQMKARQGRLAEAEADVRRGFLSRLKAVGRFHPSTAQASMSLSYMLSEQARFAEAEQLARSAVEIYRSLGYPEESPFHAGALNRTAITLFAQGRFDEAGDIYARLDVATKDWEETKRVAMQQNYARIFTSYYTGKVAQGIEIAQAQVDRTKKRTGEKHFDYAMAQATLGAGLVYGRRFAEARQAFQDGDADPAGVLAR